jgi:hypothetical protein
MWFLAGTEVKANITPSYTGPEYIYTLDLGYFNALGSATIVSHQQDNGSKNARPYLQESVLGPDGNFWALPAGHNFVRTSHSGAAAPRLQASRRVGGIVLTTVGRPGSVCAYASEATLPPPTSQRVASGNGC